jgi:hypothetical protein
LQYRVEPKLAQECERNAEAMKSSRRPVMFGQNGRTYERYLNYMGKIGEDILPRSFARKNYAFVRRNLRAMKIISRILLKKSVV